MHVMFEATAGDISGPRYLKRAQLDAAFNAEKVGLTASARVFRHGTPYFVTAPITALLIERRRVHYCGVAPTPTGFMWFEKKIEQDDGSQLRAIGWAPKGDHIASYWYGWHPKGSAGSSVDLVEASENMNSLLGTAFELMEERITEIAHVRASVPGKLRAIGRRAEEPVRVVQLRAVDHIGAPAGQGSSDTEFNCRWMVRGHPHRYWVGSGDERHMEVRYLKPYVKGPAGAPFKEPQETVFVLGR